MVRIVVKSAQLTAAAAALRDISRSMETEIDKASKTVESDWRRMVAANAKTTAERRVIAQGARLLTTGPGIRLVSRGGRLSRGLNAEDHGGAVEFGVNRGKVTTYRRSGKRAGTVRRHTARQLRQFNKKGYVFTPAVKTFIPRLKKAWTEATAEAVKDALKG